MDLPKSEKLNDAKPFPFFHPLSRRFHLVLLLMMLIFCMSWMRGNLAMTMTCMVNTTAVSMQSKSMISQNLHNDSKVPVVATKCHVNSDDEEDAGIVNDYGGTIIWNSKIQNLLFSATFWGALLTSVPAGYLADRTSPSNMIQISMLILTISTVLFPYMAVNTSWQFVFISRVLTGCGNGLIVPAMNTMITKWIPNKEKSMAASIFTSGNQIAAIFGLPLAAAFCASEWKWPTVFYCGAIMGAIWLVIWRTTVKNSPQKSPWITEKELAYLERSIGDYKLKKKDFHTPWRHIFTSIPVFCCISSGFAVMMVTVFLQLYLPTFFKEILFLKVVDNGFYSAAPFIAQLITKLLWSIMLDKLKGKYLSNTTAVKLSQGTATLMILVSLILLGYLPDCQKPWIAVLLCCGVSGGFGIAINGFYVSLLSLAPAYTGILSSIHMIVGFIGMIATPQIVSYFRVYGILEEWRIIFFIIAGILLVTGIIFVLFGEAEMQPWARLDLMNGKNQHNLLNVKENDSPIIQVKDKANSILIH